MDSGSFESEQVGALGAALEHEHREIDAGIDAFRAASAESERGPDGAVSSLQRAIDALRRHIYLEEELLFPAMQAELAIPIGVMLREHGEIWRTLDDLQAKLTESNDRTRALSTCEELAEQLDRHNAKEEPIFYTQADEILGTEAAAELKTFLDTSRLPAGWTCRKA